GVALKYLHASTKITKTILEVLMKGLGVTMDTSIVDAYMGLRFMNMNFYPTFPAPELTVGATRHSDIGTLTVLLQDGVGGLSIKVEDNGNTGKKGEWIEIPPIDGALVINIEVKIGPLPEAIDKDGGTEYKECLFGEYKNNFYGEVHYGKKSLDFAKITQP
ncbi:hypothetical protein IFM89_027986, partial [Coptis chinensis]